MDANHTKLASQEIIREFQFGPLTPASYASLAVNTTNLLSEQGPLERRESANSSGTRLSENRNPHNEAPGPPSDNPTYQELAREADQTRTA